jgi:hypothetical protein
VSWGTEVERERHRRIKLSMAAFTYEYQNRSIMNDGDYDKLSKEINPTISTGDEMMDYFFRNSFDSSTGMWIHRHPGLDVIENLVNKFFPS